MADGARLWTRLHDESEQLHAVQVRVIELVHGCKATGTVAALEGMSRTLTAVG